MYSLDKQTTEKQTESCTDLEKIHNFNNSEQSKNLKSLAAKGINTVKSFFDRIHIKDALQSFFKKKSNIQNQKPIQDNANLVTEYVNNTSNRDSETEKYSKKNTPDLQYNNAHHTENYTILKTLKNIESSFMQSEISDYYKETRLPYIHSFLRNTNTPKEKMDTVTDKILERLAQKRIQEFKKSVSDKLQKTDLFKEEFGKFWAWRLAHPPKEKPLLIQTNTGIKIKYDEFASDEAINDFLSNHTTTLPEHFFKKLKTSDDIEKDIETALTPFIEEINIQQEPLDSRQLAYSIEEQSNGWVNASMYEKVANLPANEALYMLGSINSELTPSSRKLLDKMQHLINLQDTTKTFDSLIQQILDETGNNPPSKITLQSLSNIINKLDKIITLSKEK